MSSLMQRFNPKGNPLPANISEIKKASPVIIAEIGQKKDGISDPKKINVEIISLEEEVLAYRRAGSLCGDCPKGKVAADDTQDRFEAGLRSIWRDLKFAPQAPAPVKRTPGFNTLFSFGKK